MTWFPLLVLLACSGDDPPGPVDPTGEDTDTSTTRPTGDTGPPETDLAPTRSALEEAGFVVGEGALVFSTMEGCCDPGANCWGNNPSTPYGAYAVPPSPGEPVRPDTLLDDFGPVPAGLSRDFLMRSDEALVWLGTMPPRARYFGFRSLLGLRPGAGYPVIGSLGAATNQLTVQEGRTGEVWGQPIALVTTADAGVEARVVEALVEAGWAPEHIAFDRMAPVVNLGLDEAVHDSIFTTMRVAVYDDPAAGAAWEASPGPVWRLTPEPAASLEPHPMPDLPQRGTGTDESAWSDARDALEAAVMEAFSADAATALDDITPYWRETLDCIDSGQSCTGDIRDRYVGISPSFQLRQGADLIVAFGVNHERTGKASYSSVSVQTIDKQRGIASVTSASMVGSARPFLDHALVDDLYVALFARDCGPYDDLGMVCVEVPWTCPGGPPGELFKITGRAYLEPATGTAPLDTEVQPDRVLLVYPGRETDTASDTGTSLP